MTQTKDISAATPDFETVRDACMRELPHLASWPGYFKRRHGEFQTLYELMPQKHWGKVLEIGCGNGFNAAFLAQICDSVVSTDLDEEDPVTHTPGLATARKTLHTLGITNVDVEPASADDLPFEDNSFDMVFSSHVIEHVPDNKRAIEEIHRVLKPGGINFMAIPTRTSHFYGLFAYLSHWIPVVLQKVFKSKPTATTGNTSAEASTQPKTPAAKRPLKRYFVPPPHGASDTFREELFGWSPKHWRKLVTANGKWPMLEQRATQLNPLMPLLGQLFPNVAVSAHLATRKCERKLGKYKIFFPFGYTTLIITQKPLED